ncbi:MAG TPA: putative S-layer protein [Nanoarchaeota archaeon]|nr:putative S-layer protein [Nanoarchaeota archaeon]HIH63682.1 putative S-layer protein [Nanoarchaeota archaeon]HIJ10063.1 putative S-layer protein [Nanoarchaeota archaeon]
MNNKILNFVSASILVLILCISFTSASIEFTDVTGATQSIVSGNTATVTFKLNETNEGDLTNISFNTPLSLGSLTSNNINGTITSLDQTNKSSLITLTINVPEGTTAQNYTGTLIVTANNSNTNLTVTDTLPITLTVTNPIQPEEITSCIAKTNLGNNLKVKIDDITVKGFGEDTEWLPMDEIQVEVQIENNGNDDIRDIKLSWGLYNKATNEWYVDGDESKFKLKDGDEETVIVTIKLDDNIDELEEGEYVLYLWANAEDAEFDNDDTCTYTTQEDIEIVIEENFVILYNIQAPETMLCDEKITIIAEVWNIGDEDQDDVSVYFYNKELGIAQEVIVGSIDAFDSEKIEVTLETTKEMEQKTYQITMFVYDEDQDVYQNNFGDDEAEFSTNIEVTGVCKADAKVTVSASLVSDGKAGEELIIKAIIANTGEESTTYTLNTAGYTAWASSASIDQNTFTLNKGEVKEVLITFDVNKEAFGDQMFNLEILSNNQLISQQPVSVLIKEADKGFVDQMKSITGKINWVLWAIILLNIILVIVIVIVAIRIAKN